MSRGYGAALAFVCFRAFMRVLPRTARHGPPRPRARCRCSRIGSVSERKRLRTNRNYRTMRSRFADLRAPRARAIIPPRPAVHHQGLLSIRAGESLFVDVEQALDAGIDAREVGQGKLRAEQQLKRDPIDRLELELAAEARHPGVAIDPGRCAQGNEPRAVPFKMGIDLAARCGRG